MKSNGQSGAARAALLGCAVLCSAEASAGDWVNDWFAQSTSTSPGMYQSQQRGYFTGGGFDARYRMTNDHLVSVTPPGIKVGCGGIDLMAGSLSYLNPEYVVQKMERILQAAPAFAFDLAMQEYCKPCTATLQFLEHTADQLNGLQMNDCQAAQHLATAIVNPNTVMPDLQGAAASFESQVNGIEDSWEKFQTDVRSNNGQSPVATKTATSGCSTDFQNTFLNGSILDNATALMGVAGYSPMMRGLVGDLNVSFNAAQNAYSVQKVNACPGNDRVTGADFYNGQIQVEDTSGNCTQPATTAVLTMVDDNLNAISTAIQSGGTLTAQQQAFVNSAPIPIYLVLKDATRAGNTAQMIGLLDIPLAQAYTARVLTDFYQVVTQVLDKADEINSNAQSNAGGNPNACEIKFLAGSLDEFKQLGERTQKYRQMAQEASGRSNAETVAILTMTKMLYEQHIQINNAHANAIDRSRAQ